MSLEHPQKCGESWLATATLVVHSEPRRIPLVIGGDRSSAWLVIEEKPTLGSSSTVVFGLRPGTLVYFIEVRAGITEWDLSGQCCTQFGTDESL
jgi:hypothetical protein